MSCDNVITVQDLETDKKHSTFYREVITGKAGGTGADIDYATNAVTGQVQKTLPATIDGLDWSYVGKFADGVTFTKSTDFAIDANGTQWIYAGSDQFPKTVPPATVPSEPTYQAVHVKSASAISNANGGSVQDFIDAQSLATTTLILTKDLSSAKAIRTNGFSHVFDLGGCTWIATGVTDLVKAGIFDSPNGKIYDLVGTEFSYFNGKTVRLDHFGLIANQSTVDGKSILDDVMAFAETIEMDGDYYVSNVNFPNKRLTFRSVGNGSGGVQWSLLRTIEGFGDSTYFAAPLNWINNTATVSEPISTDNVGFFGGTKSIGLVIHNFFNDHNNLRVKSDGTTALLMTAKNKNGTATSTTAVNNRIRNIWLDGLATNGLVIDEDGKSTDWQIVGGYIFNSGGTNLQASTMGGAVLQGVHCFGSPISAKFRKWSKGTTVNSCFFERDVEIGEGLFDDVPFNFGPDNTVSEVLRLNFGGSISPVRSNGNILNTVLHNYFGNRAFYSNGDSYTSTTPFSFVNTGSANTAKIRVKNAIINGESRSGELAPELSATTVDALVKDFRSAPFLSKKKVLTNTISHAIKLPELGSDESYTLIWDVASRLNHDGATDIAASYRFNITRKVLTTSYGITQMLANIQAGSFSTTPSISISVAGGIMTVTVAAVFVAAGFTAGSSNIEVL